MAFQKGQSGNPAGRPKGEPNKLTSDVKAMILQALELAGDKVAGPDAEVRGGVAYLADQAQKNPAAFCALVGKVLPLTLQGDASAPFVINVVKRGGGD